MVEASSEGTATETRAAGCSVSHGLRRSLGVVTTTLPTAESTWAPASYRSTTLDIDNDFSVVDD
jgi:hypothetical protein